MQLQRLIALTVFLTVASVAWSQIEMRPGASRSSGSTFSETSEAGAGGGVSQHNAPYAPSRRVTLPDEFKAESADSRASTQAATSVVQASKSLDEAAKPATNWLGGIFLALGAGLTLIITGKVLLDKYAPSAPVSKVPDFSVEQSDVTQAPTDYVQTKL